MISTIEPVENTVNRQIEYSLDFNFGVGFVLVVIIYAILMNLFVD